MVVIHRHFHSNYSLCIFLLLFYVYTTTSHVHVHVGTHQGICLQMNHGLFFCRADTCLPHAAPFWLNYQTTQHNTTQHCQKESLGIHSLVCYSFFPRWLLVYVSRRWGGHESDGRGDRLVTEKLISWYHIGVVCGKRNSPTSTKQVSHTKLHVPASLASRIFPCVRMHGQIIMRPATTFDLVMQLTITYACARTFARSARACLAPRGSSRVRACIRVAMVIQ